MILKQPYGFELLKLTNLSQTLHDIERFIVTDYAFQKQEGELAKIKSFHGDGFSLKPVFLLGRSEVEKDIVPFNHPLINEKGGWVAFDLRAIVKVDRASGKVEVRNEAEFQMSLQRLILSTMWYCDKQTGIYSLKLPHIAFGRWLSENLTKRFGLSLVDKARIEVLAFVYYAKLFTNEFTTDDLDKLKIRLSNEIFSKDIIDEITEKVKDLENIQQFCEACYVITGNVRLKGLNSSVLVNVIQNNWFGLNAKELTLLALEHPPTWISLVYGGLTQRNFSKNYIGDIVEKLNKRGAGDEFLKALVYLTKDYKEE